ALLNTGSRGGVIAGAVVLPVVAWLSLRGTSVSRKGLAITLLVCAVAILAIAVVAGNTMAKRLSAGGDAGDRPLVFRDTIAMILDRPLLGHGAGSFADIFPLYHNLAPSFGVWFRAHNTYLQAAAELGLPVAILLALTTGAVLWVIYRES